MKMSNKIVSFPELKKCIEENFLCKLCLITLGLSGINASTLSVWQDTYGIATVLKISCGNHHMVEIIPECLNNEAPRHSTKNFVLNYKLLIIMQFLLGKRLKTISIVTALLGMHVALGNYKIWKELLGKLGTLQEELAQKCCNNLQKEINATVERGNHDTQENRVGIVASGDAGWQDGYSCMTYNSISGHTLLIGGYTKLVVAYKFFLNVVPHATIFISSKRKMVVI